MAKRSMAGEFLSSRQNVANDFAESRGVDHWTRFSSGLQKQADDFGNYLNSGNYTTADTEKYRSSANKAVEDLTAEMSRYGKNSNEYKTLDGYRQFYQNSLGTFDRMDVGTTALDYANDTKSWRPQEDYDLQKQSLQDSISKLEAEMEKIEDKNSADYKELQGWKDWYSSIAEGLNARAQSDALFETEDDFLAYENSTNYQHVADVRRTLAEKRDELAQIDPNIKTAADVDRAITNLTAESVDAEMLGDAARMREIQNQLGVLQQLKESGTLENLEAMQSELDKLNFWENQRILYENYKGYNPDFDYQAKADELRVALKKAEEGSDKYEEIAAQLRAIAGPNGDGKDANGLYDENTWLGRYIMENFDVDEARKEIEQINKELEDRGLPKDRIWGMLAQPYSHTDMDVDENGDWVFTDHGNAETDPEVIELRRRKTELTQKLNSSERVQKRSSIEEAAAKIAEEEKNKLLEAGESRLVEGAFGLYGYRKDDGTTEALPYFSELEGDNGGNIRGMILTALGAKELGVDIGYTIDDVLKAYEGQINDIAGYKAAKKVNDTKWAPLRWTKQMFGQGGLVGGAISNIENLPGLFRDEYKPTSKTQAQIAYTGEMMGDQYDNINMPGGRNLAQTLHEAAVTTGNMLPSIGLSALVTAATGGAGAPAAAAGIAGQIAGAIEMGLSSGGQSYQQMLGMGYDQADSRAYGALMGTAEAGTQYLLGGITGLGGVSEDALLNLAKGIGNGAIRATTELAIHDFSEISEELVQNRIERYFQYNLFDQGDANWWSWNEDDWYTVVVTALSTSAMEGPGVGLNAYRETQLGKLASGAKSLSEAQEKALLRSKIDIGQNKTRKALASQIGKAMKSSEALVETLQAVGSSMDENTDAYELAKQMIDKKIPANDRNLGELFTAILSDTTREVDGKTKIDYDKFMAEVVGGAIKYNEIEAAKVEVNDKGQTLEQVRKENPGANVLDTTASKIVAADPSVDATQAAKTAVIINKVLSGKSLTASEMQELTGNSSSAKAARVVLSERNDLFKADMNPVLAETAVTHLIDDMKARAQREKIDTRTSVLQAAMDAANRYEVNRAAAGAEVGAVFFRTNMGNPDIDVLPTTVNWNTRGLAEQKVTAEEANAYETAVRNLEIAKQRLETLKNMTREEAYKLSFTDAGALFGVANAKTLQALGEEHKALRGREDELKGKKFPTKAEKTELEDVRHKLAENLTRYQEVKKAGIAEAKKAIDAAERAKAEAEGKTEKGKAEAKKGKGKKGIPPKQKGEETVAMPNGGTMTRAEFNGTDEEWNNMVAQSGGTVMEENTNEQQTADRSQGRNAMGERGDRGEDQARGDRPEQGSDAGGDRSRRKLSTFDGSREVEIDEEVDSDATITRNDDVSGLEESHPGIREFTDSLMNAGFKRITYVSNGNIYNVEGEAVPGFYNNGELFLSLDPHPGWAGYEATAEHEKLHLKLALYYQHLGKDMTAEQAREEVDNFISATIQNIIGEASYIDAFRKYWKRYSPVYLRNNDIQTVAHMVNEEMLCDMIGGIDNFDAALGRYQDSLQDILDASHFNSVADALANRPDENPGTVTTEALDPGAMPHNVPVDTLISGENVDTPSTGIASIQSTSRHALYGFTRALGFSIDGENKVYYKTPEEAKARINSFTEVSKSDVENSPLGELIEYAKDKGYISEESMQRQFQLFADIGTISEKTADLYSAMQFYGSVLFTAMKLNSDKQYGLSEDIANICTKTQSMIDGMSEEMKRVKRGLGDDEILQIYQRNVANGLPVNCPECYVFSRWIGIGGLLDNIYRYQEKFSKMSVEEVAKEYDELFDEVITKFKNDRQAFIDKAVANGMSLEDAEAEAKKKFSKGKSRSKLVKETEKRYNDLLEKREELQAQGKDLSPKEAAELEEKEGKALSLRALVWINNVYFGGKDDHSAKNVNPRFAVPSDILFDLNAGEEFALHYPEAWAFRTTQGAGYGKAIVPTAEANLGESILVTGDTGYMKRKADAARKYEGDSTDERHRVADQFNIFLNQRGRIIDGKNKKGTRDNVLNRTTKKGLNQLFLGGQRLQSTSDSRFDTAIDTLMIMTELQAMHAGAQIYTKVLGAVPFYDAVAGFVNMSAMPFGGGLDKDGNPIDTPTGGVDMRQAIELRKQCPRAGTITIGVNDAHIRAMFKQVFRDFIIPYHASGGKIAIVAEMRRIQEGIAAGKYKMPQSTDYTLTQTDKFLSDTILKNDLHYTQAQIDEIHRYRDMRIWLLTGGKKGKEHMDLTRTDVPNLTPAQENARRIFQQLYISTRQPEGKWYGLSLGKGIIEGQIFPNEFWDTTATYDGRNNTTHSGVNTQRYLDYCEALGVLHRFSGKGVKTGKAPTVDGGMVMRGHIYNVDGRDPTGAKVPLTDLAYQVDEKGNYLLNEYGERIIEPYFWKTLTDHRMYGNEGEYLEQGAVTLDGLLDLGNPNAEEAVAQSAETFASKEKGFAHPTGEVRYDRKKSMKLASEPLPGNQPKPAQSHYALAMTDAGYETSKREAPATDDRGQVLFVEPSSDSWTVARDADGSLLNTDYLKNALGMQIFDDPKDEYVAERRRSVIPVKSDLKHKTANPSTNPSYEQAFEYLRQTHPEGVKDLHVLDASSGLGLGTQYGKDTLFKGNEGNVVELEPFPGDREVDYRSYGGLIAAIESGEEQPFDFIISNAVINVMAQDAREELLSSLLRMLKPGGQLFINPAFGKRWGAYDNAIPLSEYERMKAAGKDVSKKNVVLSPVGRNTGGEIYTAQSQSVQKGYTPAEFQAFAKDVAKQALGEDITIVPGSSKDVPGLNKGYLITRSGENTAIQSKAKAEDKSLVTAWDLGDTAYTGPKMTTAEWRKAVAEDADIYTPEMENRWGLDAFDMREMDLAMVELLDEIDDIEKKHYWSTNTFPDLKGWYDYTDFLRQLNTPDSDRLNLAKKKIQFMIRNLDERYLNKMKYYPVQEYNTEQRAALRKIINQYKKIVDAQIEAVKLNKGIGKSLQIDSRKQYKLADIRSMFEELNSNEELTALGKKVFDWAELMERNGHRIPFKFKTIPDTNTSRTGGEEFGGKVNYNTKYFNDPGTSNQEKAETLLHEVIHVYTEYAVDAVQLYEGLAHPWQRYKDGQALKNLYDSLPLHVVQAVHTLEDINKQIKYDPLFADPSQRSGRMYGTENVNEMLAELSNPKFREALKKKSLLQRILDAVKKLFGITPSNALDAVSAAFDKLMLASYDDNIQFLNESFLRYSDQYSKFSQTPAKNTAVIPAKNAPKNQSRNSIQDNAPALKPTGENTTMQDQALTQNASDDNVEETAQQNFERLKGVLDSVFSNGNDKRSANVGSWGDAERIERLFRSDTIEGGEDRAAVVDAIRRAGGLRRLNTTDSRGFRVHGRSVDPGFYTKEMLLDEKANKEHGLDTVFFVGDINLDGTYYHSSGVSGPDSVVYVCADYEGGLNSALTADDVIRDYRHGNKVIADTVTDSPVRLNGRHERFHALVGANNQEAADLYKMVLGDTAFDPINLWYQRNLNDPDFNYYAEETAAELYAGGIKMRDQATQNMVDSYVQKIDAGKAHGSKYSIQDEDTSGIDSLYPEGTLENDLLKYMENPEAMSAWINEQMTKHADALENAKIKAPAIPSKGFIPPVSKQQKFELEKERDRLIKEKGQMKPSEKSNGFVIPAKNQKNAPFRRGAQNIGSAEVMTEEAMDQTLKWVLTDPRSTYVPDSNKELIKDAKDEISDKGLEVSLVNFKHDANNVKLGTKGILKAIAMGEQLLIETAVNGDMANFIDVLSSVCELGTTVGKSLQAFQLLKQSGPIGQLYYVQKAVDRLNKTNEEKMKRGTKYKEIVVKDDLAKAVINAKTDEDRQKAMDALIADLASQAPVTLVDRLNAWRYLSMLGNARTHIRNMFGNGIFVPLRYAKDLMAAGGEFLATKAGWMEEEDRTKALSVSRDLRDFALSDAKVMERELRGNGKYNPAQEILNARRLLPGFLDTLSRKNSDYLEKEDWIFLRAAYARALSQELSHKGFTAQQLQNSVEGQKALNEARKNAILEAQKATYRDFVAVASWLNRGKHLTGAAGTIASIGLEGVLPFTKTPINILRRGVEYSPLGIAKGIGQIISGIQNGNLDVAEAIDSLAAGLTGTGVAALGWLLARMGVLRGKKSDDDEENFEKMQGYQDYSLQFGDQSFTIDWAAPTALPLFTGAAVAELMEEDHELSLKDAWNAIMMISEPMTSLSMLDGLNKLIESTAYASGNEKIATIATQAATSYLGQFFPTILGQVARSIDGTRRSTYVDKNSPIPAAAQRFVQSSVQGKIPGWENAKVPYIDAWGRTSEPSSKVLYGIENFFTPWYRSVKQTTDVDEAINDLYKKTGADILPSTPSKYFSVGGERKDLTADEYVSFATDVGQTKYELMTQLISDPRYLALDDTQKAKVIKEYIYKYATTAGKYHVDNNFDIHGSGIWIEEAEAAAAPYARFERIWEAIEKGLKL